MTASGLSSTVETGPLLVALLVSVLVGLVGFLSPCVLPLVPGYLSYVTGLSGDQTGPVGGRRTVAGAALFVGGFSAVFVAGGALFGQLGSVLLEHARTLQIVFGTVTVLLGLVFLGAFRPLQREVKRHRSPRAGLYGAPLLGVTFGLAWTPCLTPTFTAVVSLSVSQATAGRGALLAAAYCVGLGVPFVLIALGLRWATASVAFLRTHAGLVSRVGGGLLVILGLLMVSGWWTAFIGTLRGVVGTGGISI